MENLDTLQLQEIKTLCKKYNISTVGDKKSLIKKLKYYLEPVQDVLNTQFGEKHTGIIYVSLNLIPLNGSLGFHGNRAHSDSVYTVPSDTTIFQ